MVAERDSQDQRFIIVRHRRSPRIGERRQDLDANAVDLNQISAFHYSQRRSGGPRRLANKVSRSFAMSRYSLQHRSNFESTRDIAEAFDMVRVSMTRRDPVQTLDSTAP